MRLGVVGFVPGDPRAIAAEQLNRACALGVTSVCYHGPGDVLFDLTTADFERVNSLYDEAGLELATQSRLRLQRGRPLVCRGRVG